MRCSQCGGRRYRKEILDVTYRGRNIADVLEMTVREAFTFFRGQAKVQARLKRLIDVGLDYVRLGQPANTLSGGEAQRLKLAGYMAAAKRRRTLFLLDEPTTGLHFSDVVQLLDCFDALLGCRPFADRRRAQPANDEGRRLHHRPGPRRGRRRRPGRRPRHARRSRATTTIGHRPLPGRRTRWRTTVDRVQIA